MGFKCGIVGLPNVGKSTLFNALTRSNKAESANYPFATINPNIGRIAVPDERLKILSKISLSSKITPTYIDFIDIAGLVKGASKGEGLGNQFLSHIREMDAIAHVVRCFSDSRITHISKTIDPINDIETILTELKLADIQTLENNLKNLQIKAKSGEKEIKGKLNLILSMLNNINSDKKINIYDYAKEDKKFIKTLNLITPKPMIYICNVDEKSIINGNNLSDIVIKKSAQENNESIIISAEIEAQISQINNEKDKIEILNALGLQNSSLNRLISSGYNILDLITFFTTGPKETRAWTIKKNTTASQAAGRIHSDLEKGFIRSETINYEDFINYNGEMACRESGKLRQEGKDYIVKDAEILKILFNI